MKFLYADETGDESQSDVFVMIGILIDSHRLRKKTAEFDTLLRAFLSKHPNSPKELKTKSFINGKKGWNKVDPTERKEFLRAVCQLAVDKGDKLYGIGISLSTFKAERSHFPLGNSHWIASALFVASLLQKKMQTVSSGKGITALVMDDNKAEFANLSNHLHEAPDWCDGLYKVNKKVRGKPKWVDREPENRFDHIINTGFAIKSEHSSLIQVADALGWAYRRSMELDGNIQEEWTGEKSFYKELVNIVDSARVRLGRCESCDSVSFYKSIKHNSWEL